MLADFFRSPAVVETFLFVMLLSWLGGSAAMTLMTGQRNPSRAAREQDGHTQTTMPPVARAVTGSPRH